MREKQYPQFTKEAYEARVPGRVAYDRWSNPTAKPVAFRLYLGIQPWEKKVDHYEDGQPVYTNMNVPVFYTVTVGPGQTVELPAAFREAIQTENDGVIMGGLAWCLKREGSPAKVHASLNGTNGAWMPHRI